MREEFFLLPGISHKLLASFYLLQKLQLKFPRDAPLLTKNLKVTRTKYEHPEEKDESFGSCNNWDKPRMQTRIKQKDYSTDPNFKPYNKYDHLNAIEFEYQLLNNIYKFDFTKYTPKSIVTDPYHNKLKSYNPNNYTTFTKTDINTVHSITLNGTKHTNPFYSTFHLQQQQDLTRPLVLDSVLSVRNNVCHISNYKASPEELKRAKELTDARQFEKVKLDHIKQINYQLYNKTTKLLYNTLDDLFAKHQYHRCTIPKFEFKIDLTKDAPNRIFIKQYPLSPEKRLVVIKSTLQNIESGLFVYDDKSQHNVPIIVILKKGKVDRYRPAYALQHLNKFTITEPSYLPSYDYIFEILRGKGLYSTTDIKNYFECIKLRAKDQPLAHVTTPVGPYNLTHCTYGFKNAMALAQDISNYLVRPFNKCIAFVDDVLRKHAPNASHEELYDDIYQLFTRAYEIGLLLSPEKTYLFAEEVEYLGYIFNQLGVIPRPEYIQKVLQFTEPNNKKEIQQYLAVLNYIARFIPNLAEYAARINHLTHKDVPFNWTPECRQAFNTIQNLVKQTPLLAHPTDDGEFLVQTDASKYAIAAVLYQRQFNEQKQEYEWKIIEFYSKQLDKHLHDHRISVKECLAITYALNHWQHFLLRKKFLVDTDHKNLIRLYDSDEMKAANMKKKQMFVTMRSAIAQFNFQIAHLRGDLIPLPDYLSRDGSISYRKAPAYMHNHKLLTPKYKDTHERTKLQLSLNYMKHIRYNDIDYPASLQAFHTYDNQTYNHLCTVNEINLITLPNLLEKELVTDRLNMIQHIPPPKCEPLNRWITNIPHKSKHDKFQVNKIDNTPNIYAIPNQIPLIHSIEEVNAIKQNKNNNTSQNSKPKKSVTFNLKPKFDKDTTTKATKSILKNSKHINYNSKQSQDRTKKIMYLYENNIRVFDHYIYDSLEKAWTNRLYNQYTNDEKPHLTADTIADYHLFTIDHQSPSDNQNENESKNENENQKQQKQRQPNFFVNEEGKRRSQRNQKPPKKFYETFDEETAETESAKDYPDYRAHTDTREPINPHLTKAQRNRITREKKFNLSPYRTHELFKSLYSDVYKADEIDSLLSPKKLLINQQNDPICQIIYDFIIHKISKSNRKMKLLHRYYNSIYQQLINDQFYINDVNLVCLKSDPSPLASTDRLYVPSNLIRVALQYIHKSNNFSHPGAVQTQQLIKQKFYWYKWQSDSRKYVSQCPECQLAKGHKHHNRGKLAPLVSHKFNDIVHLDFFGPLHSALSVLVITDNLTGYTQLIPIFGQTAQDVITAIWNHWRPINGIPRRCLTDRGKGFISELNQRFYEMFGITGIFTSGYHPQTNAKAERRVQEAKKAIRMLNTTLNGELTDKKNKTNAISAIQSLLPSIQFLLNQKPYAFSGISPNMLTRGTNLNEPIDIQSALTKLSKTSKMKKFKSHQQLFKMLKHSLTTVHNMFNKHRWYYVSDMIKKFNKHKTDDTFEPNQQVMYYVGERSCPMKTIRPRFTGPFTITKRISHNTVKIFNNDTNESMTCHTNGLKRYSPNTFTVEQDFIRQLKELQKTNNEYKRKKGHKITKLIQ